MLFHQEVDVLPVCLLHRLPVKRIGLFRRIGEDHPCSSVSESRRSPLITRNYPNTDIGEGEVLLTSQAAHLMYMAGFICPVDNARLQGHVQFRPLRCRWHGGLKRMAWPSSIPRKRRPLKPSGPYLSLSLVARKPFLDGFQYAPVRWWNSPSPSPSSYYRRRVGCLNCRT